MDVKRDAQIHTSVLLEELVGNVILFQDKKNIVVDMTL